MKVGIISDDLTGANGVGVSLTHQGFTSYTSFQHVPSNIKGEKVAVSIDTDSRYIAPTLAKERVEHIIKELQDWQAHIIAKRIDSTFRGNIGAELEAMLKALGSDTVAVLAPSYPANSRIVIGGYMLVHHQLLHDTDIAKDPVKPINHSYLPHILSEQTDVKIGLVGLDTVSSGAKAIKDELEKQQKSGARLIICDAITNEHIDYIAEAMLLFGKTRCFPVDPGPLTSSYVEKSSDRLAKSEKRILVTVGSTTSVTTKQLTYLLKEKKLTPVYVQPDKLATLTETWDEEVKRAINEAEQLNKQQSTLVITTNHPQSELLDLKKLAQAESVLEVQLAKRIVQGLAEITKVLLQNNETIKGCFFSGGDVTVSFCERVEAEGIQLIDEVSPLVAFGKITGGLFPHLPIVTKGGLVGDETAIYKSIEYLKRQIQ